MKLTFVFRGTLLLVFMAACSSLPASPTPTPTLIPDTPTPTATTVWFPPTDTPTMFPTQMLQPTLDQRPGLGDLLFSDTFDQAGLWSTSRSASASASVDQNRLLLSISGQGPQAIVSLRTEPTLNDFYAEATVTLSLCGSKDQFGMLFRALPGNNYYRFTVSCDGQTRLERMVSESLLPLNPWLASGDAPIAAPSEVKLGVWTADGDMRFFLNDHLQFSFRDTYFHSGTLGFFVYANGSSPITASFTDLSVYEVVYSSPVPSLTPSRTPTLTRSPFPSLTPTP